MVKRISSGVEGLDTLIGGGIPEKDLILLSGTCGAGKTIFGLQFLVSNSEESSLFISFEEALPQIRDTALSFGWDVETLEKNNKIRFLKYDPFKIEDIFEIIENNIREIKSKRVVIDSISALGLYVRDPTELRRMILQVSSMLRKNDCTSILISEVIHGGSPLSRFGVEEFVTDDVIVLYNILKAGEYRKGLSVWKMRATDHTKNIHPYAVTDKGFVVYPESVISF